MDINIESISKRKENVLQKLPEIQNKNERQREIKLKPSKKKMLVAADIVRKYILKHKRKIYGGMAIDLSIKRKNKRKGIYTDDNFPDYDFYTPEPIKDLVNISNLLFEAGFKDIQGKEAFHANTYKIRVENYENELADVSYVWCYLYHKIPTIQVNGLYFVHPDYQIMDIYRVITNPMTGWLKIEKAYKRASLLEQYYILPKMKYFFKNEFDNANKFNLSKTIKKPIYITLLENTILNRFLQKRNDYIIIGDVAYNKLIQKSSVRQKNIRLLDPKSKKYRVLLMSFSKNYDNLIKDLVNFIKNDSEISKIKTVSIQKFHPFLELYNYSTQIIVNGYPVIRIYNTKICQPYQKIDGLLIGSVHLQLLMYYAWSFRNLVSKKDALNKNVYKFIIYNLDFAREHYYAKHKKLGIEKNPYQELQIECMGNEINTPFQLMIERKKTRRDFFYFPKDPKKLKTPEDFAKWNFPNRSGNEDGESIEQ